jgi:hypothetical protein
MSVAIGAGKLPRATRADPMASTTKVRGPGKSFFAAGHTCSGTDKRFTEESYGAAGAGVAQRLVTQSFHRQSRNQVTPGLTPWCLAGRSLIVATCRAHQARP